MRAHVRVRVYRAYVWCGLSGIKGDQKKGKREKKETRKYKNIDIRATIFATITIIVLKVEHMEAFGRGW